MPLNVTYYSSEGKWSLILQKASHMGRKDILLYGPHVSFVFFISNFSWS